MEHIKGLEQAVFFDSEAWKTDVEIIRTGVLRHITAEITEAYLGERKYQHWLSERCNAANLYANKFEFETRSRPYGLNIRVRIKPDPQTQKYIIPWDSSVMTFTDSKDIKELLAALGAKTPEALVGRDVLAHSNCNRVVGLSALT